MASQAGSPIQQAVQSSLVAALDAARLDREPFAHVYFYLARDDSQRALGTTLYRRRLLNPRVLLALSNMFEPVRRLEFLPNTGYLFPVGSRSWHGREEVPAGAGERNSILLVYYRDPSREW